MVPAATMSFPTLISQWSTHSPIRRLNRLLLAAHLPANVASPYVLADRCHSRSQTAIDRQERTTPTSMQALRERECSQDG
jgi:hypothetical protein